MRSPGLTILMVLVLLSFHPGPKNKPLLPAEFVLIPAGSFMLSPDTSRISVASFYMSRYEVSNRQYREFFAEASRDRSSDEITRIACDSTGWLEVFPDAEPMKTQYFSSPAFDNYPVVNVSREGAIAYCQWLQKKIQSANPLFEIEVRLPANQEWIWAAMGGRSQAVFPWGQYGLRNKKGEPMCNFKTVNDHSIYRNRKTGKPEVAESKVNRAFTSSIKSFTPNNYGLYNMCGNAAEMVWEEGRAVGGSWNDYGGDIHIRAWSNFTKPAPTVGFRPILFAKKKDNPDKKQ